MGAPRPEAEPAARADHTDGPDHTGRPDLPGTPVDGPGAPSGFPATAGPSDDLPDHPTSLSTPPPAFTAGFTGPADFPTPPSGFPVTPSGFPGAPTPPGVPKPRPADPAPRRPVIAIAVAVVVTAVATTVAWSLLTGTGQSEQAVNAYGPPPPSQPSPGPSVSASPSPGTGTGTVLATITLKSASTPGSCVTGGADRSEDTAPAPAPCDGSDRQRWKVVDLGSGAVNLQHVASEFCLDIAGYRAPGDPMQLRPCAYQQGSDAPFPEDQAFLLKTHGDKTFSLVCQDDPAISVGVTNGDLRMLSTSPGRQATRFALDGALADALD